jgi:pimeloyl-ACP methyl ester carboxylesterase
MPSATANGITIEYEATGDPRSTPVLLISGFSLQLTAWDSRFIQSLVDGGFYVIRFDNRDAGLSTWFDDEPRRAGGSPEEPRASLAYSLGDMARDAVGLLDHLDIPSAHVVGYSMGGMIAQTLALEHPERVRTLTSISSTTGDPAVGYAHPEALEVLLRPAAPTRDDAIEQNLSLWRVIGSPDHPLDDEAVRARAASDYDRAHHPSGAARQLTAIVSQSDRTAALAGVAVPTLVIHGEADVLIDPSGGVATARAVPGARLRMVPGLGHDIHPDIFEELAGELRDHFRRVEGPS